MYNEIRSTRNLSSSARSINIKDKLKNTFNENTVFKKLNVDKTNTEYVMSKESDELLTLQIFN